VIFGSVYRSVTVFIMHKRDYITIVSFIILPELYKIKLFIKICDSNKIMYVYKSSYIQCLTKQNHS